MAFDASQRNNDRGQVLYTVAYRPQGESVALLTWHHGYGEHVGRYKPVFEQLAAAGIAVHSYDAHGHGRSEPKDENGRVMVHDFQHLVDDYVHFIAAARAEHPEEVPLFVGGHSLGGLVALCAALRSPVELAGLLLSSPLLYVKMSMTLQVQAALSRLLCMVAPYSRSVPAVKVEYVNPEPELVAEYVNDPLNDTGLVRMQTARQILLTLRRVEDVETQLALPLFVFHGNEDRITDLQGSQRLVKRAASTDKTLLEVPGGYHELLMNPRHRPDLVRRMAAWIRQRSLVSKI